MHKLQLQNHPLFNGSAPQSRGPAERGARGAAVARQHPARLSSPGGRRPRTRRRRSRRADESAAESGLISQFLGGVNSCPRTSTRLVEIVYISPDPEFAALAATTLAEEYAQQNLDLRLETINKNLPLLDDEVAKQEKKVTEPKRRMAELPRASRTRSRSSDRQNIVVARLNTLNDTATTRAHGRACRRKRAYNQLKSIDPEERRRRRLSGHRRPTRG